MWLNPSLDNWMRSTSVSSRILDLIPGAVVAHSLRKLSSAYAGAAVRIRRSSDSTEQDIGFTSTGDLDTAALSAFIGGGSGFATVWYDQSGNGRDLLNVTAAAQPQYGVGALNSHYGLRFAANKYLYMNNRTGLLNGKPGVSAFTVSKPSIGAIQNLLNISQGTASADNLRAGIGLTAGNQISFSGSRVDLAGVYPPGVTGGTITAVGQVISCTWDLATQTVKVNQNGTQVATSTTYDSAGSSFAATNPDSAEWGDYISYHSDPILGDLHETILFDFAVSSTNRTILDRNQGAFYGVSVA